MNRRWKLLVGAVSLLLLLAACGDTPDETVDDTEDVDAAPPDGDPIVIGGLFDMSGPTSDIGAPYGDGVIDYFEWRNEQGGIEGRPVELQWEDYVYDVATSEQLYTDFVAQGAVAFVGWGTNDTEALSARVARDEVPYLSGASTDSLADAEGAPYNFPLVPTYSDQLRIALKWIEEQGDATELAVMHHDSPFGEAPLEDGAAYVEEQGLAFGYETYRMPSGVTDFIGDLVRVQGSQDPEYIYVQNITSPAAQLAGDVRDQGMDVQLILFNWGADELFIELAGDAAEGTIAVQPFAPPATGAEGHEAPAQFLEERGDSLDDRGARYVMGWYAGHTVAEAIAWVINEGLEVTGPNIKTALEEMDPVDTGGVSVPISYSADDHRPATSSHLYQVQDGQWVLLEEDRSP